MNDASTITLFTEPAPPSRRPSAVVVSATLHGVLLAMILLGVFRVPRIKVRYRNERFTLRVLKLQENEVQKLLQAQAATFYPGPVNPSHASAQGGKPALTTSAPPQAIQHLHAPQTLVQPDLPQDLLLAKKIPIPQMLLWSPETVQTPKIVMAPIMHPMASPVRPVIEKPNQEPRLADVKLTATPMVHESMLMLAGNTSPIVLKTPAPQGQAPQSASASTESPTPARVLSISDVRMINGAVPLPRVNESAHNAGVGLPAQGVLGETSQSGSGKTEGNNGTPGAGAGNGVPSRIPAIGIANTNKPAPAQTQQAGSTGQSASGDPSSSRPKYDRVVLPHDGQFGVVVVGSSIADRYPETAELWSGRLASTVYVHVGLARSWILQYSLPRASDGGSQGTLSRVEAPWPYDIARPTLSASDMDADALMVHGFVNKDGRFETLSVVFPPQFAKEKSVLDALNQWQFRPAMQNRQAIAVEVLLVIPDQAN